MTLACAIRLLADPLFGGTIGGSTTTKCLHYSRTDRKTDLRKVSKQIDYMIANPSDR